LSRLLFHIAKVSKQSELVVRNKRSGTTKVQTEKDLKTKQSSVRHWLIVDDINVSHILRISSLHGLNTDIAIKPTED